MISKSQLKKFHFKKMLNLKHIKTALFIGLMMCFSFQSIFAAESEVLVQEVKFTNQNNLEISLSGKNSFKVFALENPNRLVIDINNANLAKADYTPSLPFFASAFRNKKNGTTLRLVFDLKQKITIEKIRFEKVKNQTSGKITAHIITSNSAPAKEEKTKVETKPATETKEEQKKDDFISSKVEEFEVQTRKIVHPDGSATYIVKKIPKNPEVKINTKNTTITPKIPVIVIDSGHGGKDPGTIGNFARTKEKNLTLSYAKELGKLLVNTKRYKVYLTRDTDNFIPLRQRVEIARKKKADLFISLHANSISDHGVSGFSIYTLSEKSSDKQAELLAQKENRADIISGVDFEGASKDIMKTLIDLSQRESKNSSARFANIAIKSVKNADVNILQNTHRFAGFAVLTAPDMASVLIELGYLSNNQEEKLLNSLGYKRKIAESIVEAIDEFFKTNKS